MKDRKFFSPKIKLEPGIIYKVRGREIYFDTNTNAFDENNDLLEGNFILESLNFKEIILYIHPGADINQQTKLNNVDDILIIFE